MTALMSDSGMAGEVASVLYPMRERKRKIGRVSRASNVFAAP